MRLLLAGQPAAAVPGAAAGRGAGRGLVAGGAGRTRPPHPRLSLLRRQEPEGGRRHRVLPLQLPDRAGYQGIGELIREPIGELIGERRESDPQS